MIDDSVLSWEEQCIPLYRRDKQNDLFVIFEFGAVLKLESLRTVVLVHLVNLVIENTSWETLC